MHVCTVQNVRAYVYAHAHSGCLLTHWHSGTMTVKDESNLNRIHSAHPVALMSSRLLSSALLATQHENVIVTLAFYKERLLFKPHIGACKLSQRPSAFRDLPTW